MKSNWEISFDYHLQRYSEINPAEVTERTGIEFDSTLSRFVFDVLGFHLFAEFPEFKLSAQDRGTVLLSCNKTEEASPCPACPKALTDFQMQVLVMRVLTAGVYAPATDNFKAYRELPWGDVYDRNFNGRCIKRFAYGFGFKPDVFAHAAEALGGRRFEHGDAAYEFDFFGGVKCRFILWKPDEEFPPSAQILFSDNAALMYDAEDLAAVGDVVISALKEVSKKA